MHISARALGSLCLFILIGLVGLGFAQALSFQAPRGLTGDGFVRWGCDRLLWDWKSVNGLTCFNQFTKTSPDGFFCEATQLTAGLAEDLAISQYRSPSTNSFAPIGRYSTQDTGSVHKTLKPTLQTFLGLLNAETQQSQYSQDPKDKGKTCLENTANENNLYWYPQHIFPTAPPTAMNPCQ